MKTKMTLSELKHNPHDRVDIGDTIEIVEDTQIVDLCRVIGTRIPMLFGDNKEHGYLTEITGEVWSYNSNESSFPWCEFDTNEDAWVSWGEHISWYDAKCPVPDGVEYEVIKRGHDDGAEPAFSNYMNHRDIIAFRITGLKDGWEYPQ